MAQWRTARIASPLGQSLLILAQLDAILPQGRPTPVASRAGKNSIAPAVEIGGAGCCREVRCRWRIENGGSRTM